MKKMLYFSLLLSVGCWGEKPKSDATEMRLVGDIESVRIESFRAEEKFGSVQRGKATDVENYFILFNQKGNQKERIFYDTQGKATRKYTYAYNDENQRIEVNLFKENGEMTHKYLYQYDNKGNRIEINDYTADGKLFMKEKQTFDEDNWPISRISYDANGKFLRERKFLRDKHGNIQEETLYSADGSLKSRTAYFYDEKGNPTKEERYAKNNMLESTKNSVYEFDKHGNWIKRTDYQNSKPTFIVERTIVYAASTSDEYQHESNSPQHSTAVSTEPSGLQAQALSEADEVRHQPYQKIDDGYYNFHESESLLEFAKRIMPKLQQRIVLVKNNLSSTPSEENDRIYSSFMKENNVLLESLNDKLYEGFNHDDEKKINQILMPMGLELIVGDGESIELQRDFYHKIFAGKLTPESNDFMKLIAVSDYLYYDAGVTLTLKDFGEYIFSMEQFVTNYPNSRKSFNLAFTNNKEKLAADIGVYLLGQLDNHHHVVWSFSGEKLSEEAVFEFRRYAKAHPTSKVTELIYILLDNPSMNREQLTLMVEREIKSWLK